MTTAQVRTIKVDDFLKGLGLSFHKDDDRLKFEYCPFCKGGKSRDRNTFIVFSDEGNYKCSRSSCAQMGTFYALQEKLTNTKPQFYAESSKAHLDRERKVLQFKTGKEFNKMTPSQTAKTSITPLAPQPVRRNPLPTSPLMPIAGVPLAYMLQRGFDQGTLSSLGIQMSPGGDIAYVYYKNGERVDTKYRIARKPLNGEPKCRRDEPTVKGAVVGERCFYLRDFCDPSKGDTLVITAGEANTATLWMAGIKNNVVNGPDGESSIKWIEYEWDLLEKFKWITLWADQDEGGNNWVEKIVTRLGVGRVKVVQPPVQANDANESLYRLTKTHGREEALRIIREAVLNAVPLTIEDLYVLADIQPKEVNKDGDLCGIPDIDRVLGGFRPGLTTVSGDTGDGKSTGLRGFIAEFVSQKLPVFWWDGESRKEKSQERFDLIVAGPNYLEAKTSERTGATWYTPRKEVLPYIHNWYREFVHLYAPPSPPDILTLLDSMTQAFRRHGCKHFVIDNLMKLTLADKRDEYRVQAEIINKLKDFADEFGVHVMIVTHTKKDSSRPDAPPTTSDTKGAGEINKLADVAIAFWRVPDQIKSAPCMRNGEANMMYGADGLFIINKDRETGVEGVKIPLSFNSQATRFRGVNDAIQPPKDYGWVEAYEADKKSKLKVVPPPPPTQATKVTDEMQDEIDAFMSIAFPE